MMSRHIFLAGASSQPSARWREAFPHGLAIAADALVSTLDDAALLWLSSADEQWQQQLDRLSRTQQGVRVIVLSEMPDDDEALRALELGARAYCHARAVPSMLREAALAVEHGGLWVGASLLARFLGALRRQGPAPASTPVPTIPVPTPAPNDRLQALSARELEVARVVAEGLANKEVAQRLGISERTVKAHLGVVFDKLGVRDRLQLALKMAPATGMEQGERHDLHQVR